MRILAVVPTYNEAANLAKLAGALFELQVPNFQLLVVDDNSPDGTGAIADQLATELNRGLRPGERPRFVVLHRQGKSGLSTAYVAGMTRALAEAPDIIAANRELQERYGRYARQRAPEVFPEVSGEVLVIQSLEDRIAASNFGIARWPVTRSRWARRT